MDECEPLAAGDNPHFLPGVTAEDLAAAIKAKEPMPEQRPQMADIPLELAAEMVSAALKGVARVPSAGLQSVPIR